jgi:hypothetical protein
MRFSVRKSVTVGDILTCVSILLSALALVYQLSKDRQDKRQERSNEVRAASARTLASLERWGEISLSFFDEIQPTFIDTSLIIASGHAIDKAKARDFLYKKINEHQASIYRKISDEKVITSYVGMYQYNPSFKAYFENVLGDLKLKEDATFDDYLISLQEKLMAISYDATRDDTALVGDTLRNISGTYRQNYRANVRNILDPVSNFLSSIINKSDDELLNQNNLKAPIRKAVNNPTQ